MSRASRRVMLLGPMPPPDHGTSVPFRLLVEAVQRNRDVDVRVVNTQSGDKEGIPLYSPRAFMPFFNILRNAIKSALWCDTVISYGSQRYSCTVAALLTLILRLLGKPMHVRVAGGGFDNYYFGLPDWKRALLRLAFERAATVIVETRLVGSRLAGEFTNLKVVPNWIDLHGFEPQAKVARALTTIRFGFAAEIRAEKGVETLIRAFKRVRNTLEVAGIHASLELVGPIRSDFAEQFKLLMNECGAGVTHIGQVSIEELVTKISQQDIMLLPTIFPNEGYPGVMLEALALGVPLIVSRWRALPEVVVDAHNGLICEPGDVASLALQMERLAQNPDLRAHLSLHAIQDSLNFRAETVLKSLFSICGLTLSEKT